MLAETIYKPVSSHLQFVINTVPRKYDPVQPYIPAVCNLDTICSMGCSLPFGNTAQIVMNILHTVAQDECAQGSHHVILGARCRLTVRDRSLQERAMSKQLENYLKRQSYAQN
jgi:hypothetical protein